VDGTRFRFGVAGGVGFFTAETESGSAKVSCTYYGADLRLGAQINDLFGVYAQPTLGYYSANGSGGLAAGGLLGMAVVADATFIDRFFVGAGVGYTVYNSPAGVTPIRRSTSATKPSERRSASRPTAKSVLAGRSARARGRRVPVLPRVRPGGAALVRHQREPPQKPIAAAGRR